MDNRDTLLNIRSTDGGQVPLLDLDLRDLIGKPLLGRRGELQVSTRLVLKGDAASRQRQSMFRLWADVQVIGPSGAALPVLGRAVVADPVFFGPGEPGEGTGDPWTRVVDPLVMVLDYRQLDEIEQVREGGAFTFTFATSGLVHRDGEIATLYPSNHQLTYQVNASAWQQCLTQLGYGACLNVEVPLAAPDGLTGDLEKAARALQNAQAAFRRGDYEEAVADCRSGLEAFQVVDKGKFARKPWDMNADREERFSWVQRSLLTITHLAHHPNDAAATNETLVGGSGDHWGRADAEAVITVLAALIRWRSEHA